MMAVKGHAELADPLSRSVSVSKPPKGDYLTFLIRDVAYKDTVGKVSTSPIEWYPPHIQCTVKGFFGFDTVFPND